MAKGNEAVGTSTVGPALQVGSEKWAGIKGAANHMIGAARRIPDAYARNVETQKAVNEQLGTDGESSPMAGLDRWLRDFQIARQERRLAQQTSPEADKNTVRKTLAAVGETIRAGLDRFGVGSVGEEYYAQHKTTEQKVSPAPPPTEEDYARDKAQREAEAQQNQTPTSEQAPLAEQEQHTGEDAAIARVQVEVVALTDEKVQEINAAESATDAVFAKGMADIAVQSRIAHEVILPYSAEGIAQLETMRSDALATLQQALDTRNRGAQPAAVPSQELTPSGAQAELAPVPVSTSEQAPQPTGFEAQVSELTDRTAQEIMASGSAMDAIRMKGEAASAVLSMAAHELMQPYLSREDAAQLKGMRNQALAALQAALDVRLESPDSHQATSVATESQPLAEAAQAPEATTAEPAHEKADSSVEENRAATVGAAQAVKKKKEGWWAHRMQTVQEVGRKAMRAVERAKAWLNEPIPDWKPKPNRSPKNYPLAEIFSQNEAEGQPHEKPQPEVAQPQETQPAPISESDNSKVIDLNAAAGIIEKKKPNPEEDFFDLALALGNKDHSDVIVTTPEKPEDPTAFGDFSRDFHDRMAELGARIAQSSTDAELNDNKSKAHAEIWSFAKEAERFPGKRFDVIRIIKMADENMQRAVNYNINNRKSGGQAA